MIWRCRDKVLECGSRPLVMGVLNVTPDSFSDGGRYTDIETATAHGLEMIADAADIIDIGGESTRPGADSAPADEEIRRVLPVIERLAEETGNRNGVAISIDTMKAEVARKAIDAGADIVNDVSALTYDPGMIEIARQSRCGVVLMHMLGNPRVMQDDPKYGDVVAEVGDYLRSRVKVMTMEGLDPDTLAVDPGIGFGKTLEHNLSLLANMEKLRIPGRPIVIGLSRKSFLGMITGRDVDDRLASSVAALAFCVDRGADVMRVHDVRASVDAARVVSALKTETCDVV